MSMASRNGCEQAELACAFVLQALGDEERAGAWAR